MREARRFTRSDEDAQEVAQEALLRAWRARRRCQTPAQPEGWVVTITRNEALRRLARPTEPPTCDADEGRPDELDDDFERVVARADLGAAMRELAPDERRLLMLRYSGDLTHSAIAAALAIPEGTTKVRLHRLRGRLRERLEEYAE